MFFTIWILIFCRKHQITKNDFSWVFTERVTYCLCIGEAHHTLIFELAQIFHKKYKKHNPTYEFVSLNIYIIQPVSTVNWQKNNPAFELWEYIKEWKINGKIFPKFLLLIAYTIWEVYCFCTFLNCSWKFGTQSVESLLQSNATIFFCNYKRLFLSPPTLLTL